MRKLAILAVVVAACATAGPAYGQATRTWVSENGNDVNPFTIIGFGAYVALVGGILISSGR